MNINVCGLKWSFKPKQPDKSCSWSVLWPLSHCPFCHNQLKIRHNIPLISYILLKGQCAYCHSPIHWQYPLVEWLSGCACVLIVCYFGLSFDAFMSLILVNCLIILSAIDIREYILPDQITLSLLWFGLLANMHHFQVNLDQAVVGAFSGYISLWLFNYMFKCIKKQNGMGHGDFKLFSALGAWFGYMALPFLLFISCLIGILGALILSIKSTKQTSIPFGPALAITAFFYLFYGQGMLLHFSLWN
jgi:leader peptidase (prepilin peptidase)/N-methyltransferase